MTQPSATGSVMSLEEASTLDAEEMSGELVNGKWVPVTRGTWRHGRITGNVVFALKLYAKKNTGWSVATADPGTKLRKDPAVLRGPDVGVIRAEREPTGRGTDGWLEGAPDVAVEVLGDDQTTSELLKKALEYLSAGSKMVWLVDPDARQVVVVTPPDRIRVLGPGETLEGADVLPGFAHPVADLFE